MRLVLLTSAHTLWGRMCYICILQLQNRLLENMFVLWKHQAVWMYHILSGLRRMTAGALSHWAVWSSGVCCFVARLHFRLTWLQLQTEQLNWSKWKPGFCFIYKEARQHSTYGVNVGECFCKFKNINGTKVLLKKRLESVMLVKIMYSGVLFYHVKWETRPNK